MTGRNEQLTAKERIVLSATIPTEATYLDMKILRKFRESLSFSEEEHKVLGFTPTEDGVEWDDDKDPNKVVHFGRRVESIVIDALTKLNDTGKLKDEHISLYEKFVGVPDE